MKGKKADIFHSANNIYSSINKLLGRKNTTMSKRFLSLFMALVLCFTLLPPAAFAETEAEPITVQEQQEQQEPEALPAAQDDTENEIAVQLAEDEYVAKIGPVLYLKLADAFEAASMQPGSTIELLKDAALTDEADSLSVSGDITLDTCGFSIQSENAKITVARNGRLTVENSRCTDFTINIPIFIENSAVLEASGDQCFRMFPSQTAAR